MDTTINGTAQGCQEVWSSADGVSWTKMLSDSLPHASYSQSAIVYDNKIWVTGGYWASTRSHDVFYSGDGNWWHCCLFNDLPGRANHSTIVFDKKMWIIAGQGNASILGFDKDFWVSIDGYHWPKAVNYSTLMAMYSHSTILLKDTVYTIGGMNAYPLNSIYKLVY
jgi:hypothetical protein